MFGFDTCSWLKLDLLANSEWQSVVSLLFTELDIFTTHEVVEELKHFLTHRDDWIKQITIRTRNHKTYSHFVGDVFDPADASLLSLSAEKNVVLVTEDPAMLAESVFLKGNVIQLIDLLFLLLKDEKLSHHAFNQLLKFFRQKRNITKKKASLY